MTAIIENSQDRSKNNKMRNDRVVEGKKLKLITYSGVL
jgi:hypothetical protein